MAKRRIDYGKIGKLVGKGTTLQDAMIAGGFASTSARRGEGSMSDEGKLAYESARDAQALKTLGKFANIGKQVTAQDQENLVRGALLSNVAEGKDNAPASLKMLGADKRVNMFQPESTSGVIIIQAAPIPSFDPPEPPSRYLKCGCRDYCVCQRKALP
jgi:hypothetical protein